MVNDNAPRLNPRDAAFFCLAIMKSTIAAKQNGGLLTVPLMIGNPGVGKTSIARQIAEKLGFEGVIIITPTMHNALDLRGLWYVDENKRTRSAPSVLLPESGKWLVLVDELADCPIHEQSGFYQLLLDGKIGEFTLPPDSYVIGATNDETMGACANPLSSAIKTRVAPVYVTPDTDQTIRYAFSRNWHPRVIGFIRTVPEVLKAFNPDDYAGGATPRGLEQLSQLEYTGMSLPQVVESDSITLALCCSLLGVDYGTQYAAYRKLDLPDLEQVFKMPAEAEIPQNEGTKYAFSAMIASATKTNEQYAAVAKYAARMGRVDMIGLMADCYRACPDLKTSATYANFCLEHGELII